MYIWTYDDISIFPSVHGLVMERPGLARTSPCRLLRRSPFSRRGRFISFPRLLVTAPVADHSPSGSPSQSTRAALLLSMMLLGALKSLATSPMGVCASAIDEGRAMELIRRHLRPAGGGGGWDLTDPETGRTIGCRDFQYAYGCAPATGEAGLTGIAARAVLLDGCGRPVRKGPLHLLRDWRARTLNVRRRGGSCGAPTVSARARPRRRGCMASPGRLKWAGD